ncbi:uncharacterized protein B0J16DRAFT_343285 [Fusarium flagelliforme]|uniref:uncharacterized protein n=1 Tax=Fusarium flagelliforme TaxID=2675880 RepID=UPI001E8CBFC6|nr:uncharacterized protein B0J16DRAFT_343285 [Fusarium flagelliforme]KAH7186142.1 hypothetical protein B0J16DRAFT_343285 [Fusarium flagelliforme]
MPEPCGQSENCRTHRKSQIGCDTCKKRLVKGDEIRLRCATCTFGSWMCVATYKMTDL